MKIYTRTGDSGETGLFGGPRVGKDAPRIAAYGDIDELNAVLGLAAAESLPDDVASVISRVQNQLFDVGAELAMPDPARHGTQAIGPAQIAWQEATIDLFEAELQPLKQFILPGGTRGAALCHMARCVCRRAERQIVHLSRLESISPQLVIYVNRLSDLLFVVARLVNARASVPDVAWQRGM